MLQPQNRLRDSGEIMETLRRGARFRLPYCEIYVVGSAGQQRSRFACIAGKRVHAHAVVRHAVQRRLRAVSARIIPCIPVPCDVVIVVSSSVVLDMDFNSLVRDVYYGILQGFI